MKKPNPRFAFIEAMLIHYGSIRRVHLKRAFNLGNASATRILSEYTERYPNTMKYNMKLKRYIQKNVTPINLKNHGGDALMFLSAIELIAGRPVVEIETEVN